MNITVYLRCKTLKCPYHGEWPDIEDLTVGKTSEVT